MKIAYRRMVKLGGFGLVVVCLLGLLTAWQPVLIASAAAEAFPAAEEALPAAEPVAKPPLPVVPDLPLAAPAFAPVASVTIDAPSAVQIGGDFSFTVTFNNASSSDTGYGPFIDLYFPANGIDGAKADPKDGITFISAEYLDNALAAGNITTLTFDVSGQLNHPFLRNLDGSQQVVYGTPGDQLVVIQLPFGSFVPGQPKAPIKINAHLSNLADLEAPLTLHARGGFRYGATPLDDWCCDAPILSDSGTKAGAWDPSAPVTPTLITIEKTYNGPEDETATGPNYPRTYTITVDVPDEQTVTNLDVTDYLPDNVAFLAVDSISPAGTVTNTPPTGAPASSNSLVVHFASVTGGAGDADITIVYRFFVSLNNAAGQAILPAGSGSAAISENRVKAVGDWTPVDTRDSGSSGNAVANGPCPNCTPAHTLRDKSIEIQKGMKVVKNVGPAAASPGDTVEYSLAFQISDYFAFQNVVINDVLSDGQRFDASFTPILQINGNGFTLGPAGFSPSNYTVEQDFTGAVATPPIFTVATAPHTGRSLIHFRVSDELVSQGRPNGRLLGGCVPTSGTGTNALDCSLSNDGATTGTVTFRAIIQDQFSDAYPSGDASVDHGDLLNNYVTINADLLSTVDGSTPTGSSQIDTSQTSFNVPFGKLNKSIYAVNGTVCASQPCADVKVSVGQTLTYRIQYTLPTSDFERLTLTDLLPRPVFDVDDPNADGTAGPNWVLDTSASATPPAAGHVSFGPNDTFHTLAGDNVQGCSSGKNQPLPPANADGTPCLSANVTDNSLRIDYGNYDDPSNRDTAIDLLMTVQVTSHPFTDGLFLTNQVSASEGTTNAGVQTMTNIVMFTVNSPYLVSTKSAVSSNNPNAVISAPLPVTFNAPGAGGAPWSGSINSTSLAAMPINSDISNVNAGDLVRFAIVVENQGSGLNGAFDITLKDTLPNGYVIPTGGINLQVLRGDGSAVAYTGLGGGTPDLFYSGIRLNDPGTTGACEAHSLTSGRNIVILTYDLQVSPNVSPDQQIQNVASLTSYTSQPGGDNFLKGGPLTDTALTTIPTATLGKALVSTEFDTSTNNRTQAMIGELVTYQVTLTLPQGTAPDAKIVDTLDPGLAFVGVTKVTYSSGVSASNAIAPGSTTGVTVSSAKGGEGNQVSFDFGTLTNANTDNAAADTVTLEYQAVVLNVLGNQSGTSLGNSAIFNWTSKDIAGQNVARSTPAATAPEAVTVIEPTVTVNKSATPTSGIDAGDAMAYTITLTGGVTDAFDVTFSDPLPALLTGPVINSVNASGLTLAGSEFEITGCSTACVLQTTATADIDLPVGASITIKLSGTLSIAAPPNAKPSNTATAFWTSLNGQISTPISPNSSASVERTGADGVSTSLLNNYAGQSTVVVVTSNPLVNTKSLVSTSEPSTTGNNVTIGETLRYRLVTRVPEGTMSALQLVDTLPTGLGFLNDGTASVALICDGPATPCITSSTLSGAGLVIPGSAVATPTFALPASAITSSTNATTGVTTLTFSLGDVTNLDNDASFEYVVIEFNAQVLNISTNTNGRTRDNTFVTRISGAVSGSTSNAVRVTVIEPLMALSKSVTPASGLDYGDSAIFTLSASNSSTTASAFEARLTDTLPAGLTLGTITLPPTVTPASAACQAFTYTNNSTGSTVDVTLSQVAPGCSVSLSFAATLQASVTPRQTITNTGNLVYTSLPGTQTGERDGSGGVNNYSKSGSATLITKALAGAKRLAGTELNNTGNDAATQATIGELVTYQLVVTVPEGATPNLVIQDTLDPGLALAGDCATAPVYTITASAGITTDLAGGWPTACPSTTAGSNPLLIAGATANDNGRGITWALGNIANSNSDNATDETITIQFQAVVLNLNTTGYDNQSGVTRSNGLQVTYGSTSSLPGVTAPNVTVVEPTINTTKSVSAGPYNAGDSVTYTVSLANPAAGSTSAFNVTLDDPLPAQLVNPSVTSVSTGYNLSDFSITGCPAACVLTTASASGIDIPAGVTVDVQVTGTLDYSIIPGQAINNTATTRWTSLPGAPGTRSAFNTATVERDGSGGVLNGGALNDYRTSGTVQLNISNVAPEKSIVQTSEASTSGSSLTIGEIARYHLAVQIPQGQSPNLQIQDVLPAGLTFLNDGTAKAGLVCNGSAACMSSSTLGSGLILSGNSSALTPGFSLPDAAVSLDPSSNNDAYVSGSPLYFSLGTITNNDNDVDAEYVVIEFNALLDNSAVGNNLAGAIRANHFVVLVNGAQNGAPSSSVDLTVVEPALSLSKQADTNTPMLGADVHYTLTLAHTASSSSDAYEVQVTDVLAQDPPAITLNKTTITAVDNPSGCATGISAVATDDKTITLSASRLPLDCTLSLTYTATVGAPGQTSLNAALTNNASAGWSSLPGTGTASNPTGSTTPGGSGAETGERNGSTGLNSYTKTTSSTVTTTGPDLTLQKSDGGVTVTAGGMTSYTLTYANSGNGPASGVSLHETVPANTSFIPASSSPNWVCTAQTPGASCAYDLGTLDPGASGSLTFTVQVAGVMPLGVNSIENTASIVDDGTHGPDATPADNISSDSTPVTAAPDLSITKNISVNGAIPGDLLVYSLTYANSGSRDATGVVISETVPANSTFSAASSTAGWSCADGAPAGTACTYNITRVNAGASAQQISFAVRVSSPFPAVTKQVANTASIRDDDLNGTEPTGNNQSSVTTPVTTQVDLSLTKSDGGATPQPGERLVYNLTYSNPGNQDVTGVVISETVPANTTFTTNGSDSRWSCANGALAGTTCTLSLGALAGLSSGQAIPFAVIIDNPLPAGVDSITNQASIHDDGANGTETNSGNNKASLTTQTPAAPDFVLSKSAASPTASAGSDLVYSLAYTNQGNQGALNVVITETVPAYTTFNAAGSDSGWSCADNAPAGTSCTFNLGGLAAGAAGSVRFGVSIDPILPPGAGSTTNTASIHDDGANGADSTPANNSASTSVQLITTPDLRITKADNGAAIPGGTILYAINYTNSSSKGTTGVVINETVPAHTTFNAAASTTGWSCTTAAGAPGTGAAGETCTLIPGATPGTLLANESGTATFAVTVEQPAPTGVAQIDNTVSIRDDGTNGADPTPENNQSSVQTGLNAVPDLALTKTDGVDSVAPGAALTYTLVVKNNGSQNAAGVTLTDTLPQGLTLVKASDEGVYDAAARKVAWPAFDLTAGQSATRTLQVTVDNPLPAGVTELENLATVQDSGADGEDPTPEDNTARDLDNLSSAGKQLTATDQSFTTNPSVAIGEILTYEVTLAVKPGQLDNLRLVDTLDRGLAFIDCQVSAGTDLATQPVAMDQVCALQRTVIAEPAGSTQPEDAGRKMTLDFGTLRNSGSAEESVTVRYRVAVLDSKENLRGVALRNSALWRWTGGELPLSTSPVTIVEPDLSLSKTADVRSAIQGQVVTYTLTLEPTAKADTDAFDVILTDVIPAELAYVPGTFKSISGPAPASLVDATAPSLVARWESFPRGGPKAVVQFQARIVTNREGVSIDNTAQATWTSLPGDRSQPSSTHNTLSTERNYDPLSPVNVYGAKSTLSVTIPEAVGLPKTGFAPGMVTTLPAQPADRAYQDLGELWVEIPALNVKMPITGVPLSQAGWDLTWLGEQAGWLEGSAYPGLPGNSALTAHATLPNGQNGPLAQLNKLKWGDAILLHAGGLIYRYDVRETMTVAPDDLTPLKHEERPWLTLLTCRGYDAKTGEYAQRVVVRAVQVSVK